VGPVLRTPPIAAVVPGAINDNHNDGDHSDDDDDDDHDDHD
jgi:hypothetical protein